MSGNPPSKRGPTAHSLDSTCWILLPGRYVVKDGRPYPRWTLCRICRLDSLRRRPRIGFLYFPNSPSRARTYNLAVNSRSLYQLSYRGNCTDWLRPISRTLKAIHAQVNFRHYPNSKRFVKIHLFFTSNITKKRNCSGQIADYCVKWWFRKGRMN